MAQYDKLTFRSSRLIPLSSFSSHRKVMHQPGLLQSRNYLTTDDIVPNANIVFLINEKCLGIQQDKRQEEIQISEYPERFPILQYLDSKQHRSMYCFLQQLDIVQYFVSSSFNDCIQTCSCSLLICDLVRNWLRFLSYFDNKETVDLNEFFSSFVVKSISNLLSTSL